MAAVCLPARCAVAVVCGDHLISQVYPAAVPVEVFLDDIVELLNDDLKRRGASGLDPGLGYELQRVNGSRLDITRTLDELGIEDGMTLVLAPAGEGDSFEPQCESLSTALARVGKKLFTPVTAETAAQTAVAILGMIALTLLALGIHARWRTDSVLPALVTAVSGTLIAAFGIIAWRWWPMHRPLFTALIWLAIPLLTAGITLGIPGNLGAAHVFVAALAIAALTSVATAMTHRYPTLAAAVHTLCALGATISGIRMFTDASAQRLGITILALLLLSLSVSPTVALWAARIRPPHFGSITGRDLFQRSDGLPIDVVAPVDDDIEDNTPSGESIAHAARRANSVLTGLCLGNAIALPTAVWSTVSPGGSHGHAAAVLAMLFVIIFISRARGFSDSRQAVALVCGAAAALCAGVARYVLAAPAGSASTLLVAGVILATFGGAAMVAALAVPATRFTPLVRMAVEWLELLAVIAALPLAAWISGLFAWVRLR